ncbi:unnamed protein product, partial [Discosporangium mesarthrocarpum]
MAESNGFDIAGWRQVHDRQEREQQWMMGLLRECERTLTPATTGRVRRRFSTAPRSPPVAAQRLPPAVSERGTVATAPQPRRRTSSASIRLGIATGTLQHHSLAERLSPLRPATPPPPQPPQQPLSQYANGNEEVYSLPSNSHQQRGGHWRVVSSRGGANVNNASTLMTEPGIAASWGNLTRELEPSVDGPFLSPAAFRLEAGGGVGGLEAGQGEDLFSPPQGSEPTGAPLRSPPQPQAFWQEEQNEPSTRYPPPSPPHWLLHEGTNSQGKNGSVSGSGRGARVRAAMGKGEGGVERRMGAEAGSDRDMLVGAGPRGGGKGAEVEVDGRVMGTLPGRSHHFFPSTPPEGGGSPVAVRKTGPAGAVGISNRNQTPCGRGVAENGQAIQGGQGVTLTRGEEFGGGEERGFPRTEQLPHRSVSQHAQMLQNNISCHGQEPLSNPLGDWATRAEDRGMNNRQNQQYGAEMLVANLRPTGVAVALMAMALVTVALGAFAAGAGLIWLHGISPRPQTPPVHLLQEHYARGNIVGERVVQETVRRECGGDITGDRDVAPGALSAVKNPAQGLELGRSRGEPYPGGRSDMEGAGNMERGNSCAGSGCGCDRGEGAAMAGGLGSGAVGVSIHRDRDSRYSDGGVHVGDGGSQG